MRLCVHSVKNYEAVSSRSDEIRPLTHSFKCELFSAGYSVRPKVEEVILSCSLNGNPTRGWSGY